MMELKYNELERKIIEEKLSLVSSSVRRMKNTQVRGDAVDRMNHAARFKPLGQTPAEGVLGNFANKIKYAIRRVVIRCLKAFFIMQTEFNESATIFATQTNTDLNSISVTLGELKKSNAELSERLEKTEELMKLRLDEQRKYYEQRLKMLEEKISETNPAPPESQLERKS